MADVPYVQTPEPVVDAMLEAADVQAGDLVYDLGCGDGRIVIAAAKKRGARGVGVDIDPDLVRESVENAEKAGVSDRVKFLQQDLFETDLREATVVMLYLLPHINQRLLPKLLAELKPGTRIVSHQFDMGYWRPDRVVNVPTPSGERIIYFWVVPERPDAPKAPDLGL
jgi:SAM-dependent methyltransferase